MIQKCIECNGKMSEIKLMMAWRPAVNIIYIANAIDDYSTEVTIAYEARDYYITILFPVSFLKVVEKCRKNENPEKNCGLLESLPKAFRGLGFT